MKLVPASFSFVSLPAIVLRAMVAAVVASVAIASVAANQPAGLGAAHPQLVAFHKRFEEPRLVPVGSNTHTAFAYEYSNFSFIEGDDGIVVIDTGFYPEASARALSEYRKLSSKPIKAIVYTHIHLDHTGGIGAFLDSDDPSAMPTIYGPAGWEPFVEDSTSVLMPMVLWRAFAQNGVLLPKGEQGAVGAGIGPVPTMKGDARIVPPSVTVSERTSVNIAGVTLEFIPSPGDIASSHMMIWMPDQKVLFAGDTLGGAFPYLETSRFELDRDPQGFVESLDLALSLDPEFVVAGHGRVLSGKADVDDVVTANRDVIQFLIDQVEGMIAKGYSADQIIDELVLPESLASHPDLQPHYHRVEWMIRGMYLKRAGFVGDVMDLATHTESQEARRLVPLLGGPEAVLSASAKALEEGDARWAARLATYVLLVDPDSQQAMTARLKAFRSIASSTISSNERNRLLTEMLRDSGHLNWTRIQTAAQLKTYQHHSSRALLSMFRTRVNPERSLGKQWTIRVEINGEDSPHYWILNNSTLRYSEEAGDVDGSMRLSRETLLALYAGSTSWRKALDAGQVKYSGDTAAFVRAIE